MILRRRAYSPTRWPPTLTCLGGESPSRVDWHNAKFDMPPTFFHLWGMFLQVVQLSEFVKFPITLFYKGNTLTSIVVFVYSFQPPDIIVRVRYQVHVYHLILYRAESEASAENEQQTNRPASHCRTIVSCDRGCDSAVHQLNLRRPFPV